MSSINSKIIGRTIIRHELLDSTNDEAKRLIKQGMGDEGLGIRAEAQTAGRGKPGATWVSPLGGLYLSVIVKPYVNPQDLAPITQVAARAVVKTIAAVTGIQAEIKQPNDVLLNGKKVCGILVERVGSGEVVIGIGVNVENEIPAELADKAISLHVPLADFEPVLLSSLNDEYIAYLKGI